MIRWNIKNVTYDWIRNNFNYREIKHWAKVQYTEKGVASALDTPLIRPEPYGVVLIIGAWNYPLHLTLTPLTGAIAAGNCAVVKPSELAPETANAIANLLPRYIDPDCFQ